MKVIRFLTLISVILLFACSSKVKSPDSTLENMNPKTIIPAERGKQEVRIQPFDPIIFERTHVVLLGTGTPNANPDRQGPATAIVVNGKAYVVDCGPGVVRRASAAAKMGVVGLKVMNLNHLFITHLHSDHTAGLPDFIFTPWVNGRDVPIKIIGPDGISTMVEHILSAYDEDINVRLGGLEPANENGYKVELEEIEPGVVFVDENIRVFAFAVQHGVWDNAFGYRFETPDINICISGDTTYYPEMIEDYKKCDILIHEVYSEKGLLKRSADWQKYHKSNHISSIDLGKVAAQVKPGLLVLTHILTWTANEEDLITEIKQNFTGNVQCGEDLMLIGISPDPQSSNRFIIHRLKKSDY